MAYRPRRRERSGALAGGQLTRFRQPLCGIAAQNVTRKRITPSYTLIVLSSPPFCANTSSSFSTRMVYRHWPQGLGWPASGARSALPTTSARPVACLLDGLLQYACAVFTQTMKMHQGAVASHGGARVLHGPRRVRVERVQETCASVPDSFVFARLPARDI